MPTTDKLIIEIHGMVTANTAKVDRMVHQLDGNGQPGLLGRVGVIEQNQQTCMERQKDTKEQKHNYTMEVIAGVSMITAIVLVVIQFFKG